MAKYEKHLTGNFDELLELVTDGVLNGSMSASYENGSDWTNGTVRCAVRVFERYSYMGGNRVSMNVTLVGNDRDLFFSAITSGGSQAVFFKLNTLGEESEELRVKRWEEAGGRREKSRLCFISALHSFFHSKTGVRSGKGCPLCRLRSLKRVLTVYRELWYDFIMIKR